jgi:hypothetical protein
MWPVLVGPGELRQRLDQTLDALSGVIGAHLPLLLASDQIFHRARVASINFSEPFARLFKDGIADGSLTPPGGDPQKRSSCCLARSAGPTCSCATATAGRPNAAGTTCAGW